MKIYRFNENKLKEQNIEYLENCFIDFMDLPHTYTDVKDIGWHIQIFFPVLDKKDNIYGAFNVKNLDGVIKHNDEIGEVYKDIDTSIKKVKIKYPNIKCDLEFTWNDIEDYDYKTPASISIILSL
jgi:hypothetical protein